MNLSVAARAVNLLHKVFDVPNTRLDSSKFSHYPGFGGREFVIKSLHDANDQASARSRILVCDRSSQLRGHASSAQLLVEIDVHGVVCRS